MVNKTSIALGMFDGVHLGHQKVIRATLIRNLTPAVFTFKTLKKRELILPYTHKFASMKAAGIELIYSSDFESVCDLSAKEFVRDILVEKMNCRHVSCGYNFRFAKDALSTPDHLVRVCANYGVTVSVVQPAEIDGEPVSSTLIREAIRRGEIAEANKMLGHDLTYRLEVIEGAKLGRTIGVPTINQVIPEDCVLPKFGVYKSLVTLGRGEFRYPAITNIGVKPTISGGQTPLIETHIPGFSMDLYGQIIAVSLLEFVREEREFPSLDELKAQIQEDIRRSINQ
jgi:riboflavin kinase/FMN adenylyltransferase